MAEGVDHVAIVVPDLEAAVREYRRAGFIVEPGGRHPDLGTENALIRFGHEYLELLGVHDPATAAARGPFGLAILDAFAAAPWGGLLGYVLASHDIEADARRLLTAGIPFEGPVAMERVRPDGTRVGWRLLLIHGVPWRRPWPMVIEWDPSEPDASAARPSPAHPNGTRGIAGLEVVARDMSGVAEILQRGLALRRWDEPCQNPGSPCFRAGAAWIELAPTARGPGTVGEGVDRLWLSARPGSSRLREAPFRHGIRVEGQEAEEP
jgi:hypothetical protein